MAITLAVLVGLTCVLLLNKYVMERRGIVYALNVVSHPPRIEDAERVAEDAPIVPIVHAIITRAIEGGADTVHISPGSEKWEVLHITDGVIRPGGVNGEAFEFPRHISAPVIRCLKVMGDINPFSRKGPQEGTVQLRFQEREYQLYLSFSPTPMGEAATIKIVPVLPEADISS